MGVKARPHQTPTIPDRRSAPTPILLRDPATPPRVWQLLFLKMLGAPGRVSRQLWKAFRAQATHSDVHAVLEATWRPDGRSIHTLLSTVLTPARLFALLRAIEPEGAGPRRQDVRDLETMILKHAKVPQAWK